MPKNKLKRESVTCPKCGLETFNTAGKCKCGYKFPYHPIQDEIIMDLCTNCRELQEIRFGDHIAGAYTICPKCNNGYLSKLCTPKSWNKMSAQKKDNLINSVRHESIKKSQPTKPTVQCPYCKSTNTKKITMTSKAVHTAIFGLFSLSRNAKQWKCNDCGSEF